MNMRVQSYLTYKWQVDYMRKTGILRAPVTGEIYVTKQTHHAYRMVDGKMKPHPQDDIRKGTVFIWNVLGWLRKRL